MRLLSDINVSGKRVFLRADLDVDIEQLTLRHSSGQAIDNSSVDAKALADRQLTGAIRLQNLKPTVDYLLEHGAKQIVIAGHIGRPEKSEKSEGRRNQKVGEIRDIRVIGESDYYYEKLSTKHLIEPLEKILGREIQFQSGFSTSHPGVATTTIGSIDSIASSHSDNMNVTSLQNGDSEGKIGVESLIVLLENLRFWEGEEKNDPEFAKQLASLADVYINEAFGVCHRSHASIVGVPAIFAHVEDPEHSRRAAGLHLQEEVEQLTKLIKNSQRPMVAVIGGAKLETKIPVIEAMAKVADWVLVGGKLIHQIGHLASQGYGTKVIVAGSTPDGKDIDVESIEKFREIIKSSKTVVWNGPMGYFEGGFERGTMAIAKAVIDSGAYSVIGGGETTEFLSSKNLLSKFSFVSSGGGAMLEFLSGKELPGVVALR